MKKVPILVMAVALVVGLLSLFLVAQQPAQTSPSKAFKLGVGMNLSTTASGSSALTLIGAGEYLIDSWEIYADTGIAWEGVGNGFVVSFPVGGVLLYNYRLEALGQDVQIGPGIGCTLTYNQSPAGFGLTIGSYLLSLQAKWETKLDNLALFIKGGPFVALPIENKDFGLLLEGGIWLW